MSAAASPEYYKEVSPKHHTAAAPVGGRRPGRGTAAVYAKAIADADCNERRVDSVTEDGTPVEAQPFVYAYDEIRNALWIQHNPVYRAALHEWDRKERYLSQRVDRREKRFNDATNEIYQIVGFYAVFLGFSSSSISQLTTSGNPNSLLPGCPKIWSPVLLSLLACSISVVGIWLKFDDLQVLQSLILKEKQSQREAAARAASLRREGPRFKFHQSAKESMLKPHNSRIWLARIVVVLVMLVFTTVIILSYFLVLCDDFTVGSRG